MLELIEKNDQLHQRLDELQKSGKTIGFVPTLGALHQGHMSLISKALKLSDFVVCSIFVNPTQFNEKSDFERYPRPIDEDVKLLKKNGCHFLFIPSVQQIYPKNHKKYTVRLGSLAKVMEGANRPGHFAGVVEVVHRLFTIVKPDFAFFGEKDFQQLSILRFMVKKARLKVKIVPCSIIREKDGLAMSSRNRLLKPEHRKMAPILYKTIQKVSKNKNGLSPAKIKKWAMDFLKSKGVNVEYIEIAKEEDLKSISYWLKTKPIRVFIVARFGEIRLIDNTPIAYRPK